MSPSTPNAVLFDLDGTLIDTATGIINALKHALQHYGITPPDDATMKSLLGSPLQHTLTHDYHLPEQHVENAIILYRQHAREFETASNTVYPGIPELLATLTEAGLTLAVATSKAIPTAEETLRHAGLTQFFAVIGGSNPNGTRIHKHEIIHYTLTELTQQGHNTDAVMVGDTTFDIHGAHANNIPAIAVLWGYGTPENLTQAGANHLADSPDELARLILGMQG